MSKNYFLLLGLALGSIFPVPAQDYQQKLELFDRYIEQAREQWQVPGLAVALVKDDTILLTRGYGLRQIGAAEKVDANTVFAIASTTKAMTAVAMGMLVDEDKIDWDDRVTDHWPDFQLFDPYVSRELRVRDLFTHNTGLGNTDFLWFGANLDGEEILRRIRLAEPAYSFRGSFVYQNIMYLAAGRLIARLSGMPWEEFMQKRLFEPLGMTRTSSNRELSGKLKNRSTPHYLLEEKIRATEDESADAIAPAGGVWSCVADMAKWTRFMLDSARVDGRRLLQIDTYLELFKPQVMVPLAQFYPTMALTRPHWMTYSLGWFQHDYRGKFANFHTGSLPGTVAIIGLLPEENLGVYLLGNLDHAEVRHAIMYKAFDLFGNTGSDRDWSSEFLELYRDLRDQAQEREKKQSSQRVKGTIPSLPLKAYAGAYSHPLYGEMEVKLENEQLSILSGGKARGLLDHWHYDTFLIVWEKEWWGKQFITFGLDAVSGQPDFIRDSSREFNRIEE